MEEIELKLLGYLSANPRAEDTLRGLSEWWLLERGVSAKPAEVERALAVLVSRDLVLQRTGKDGCARYRVNARCRSGVEHLLERHAAVGQLRHKAPVRAHSRSPA